MPSAFTVKGVVNRGERVAVVCDLFDLFLDHQKPIQFRQVVEQIGLDRRTVYRYLQSFEARGLLERVHDEMPGKRGQEWRRGPRMVAMLERR